MRHGRMGFHDMKTVFREVKTVGHEDVISHLKL